MRCWKRLSANGYEFFLFFFIIFIGIIVRIWGIGTDSLFEDEGKSLHVAQRSLNDVIQVFLGNENAPLYYVLLHFWFKITGLSVFTAKILSVLFSSASLVVFYYLGRYLFNLRTAVFASLLMIFSLPLQFYAQVTRPYSLVLFFASLSILLFFKLLKEGKMKFSIYLIIANLALIFTHYVAIYLVIAEFIVALILFYSSKKRFKLFFVSNIITALLFAPWFIFVLFEMLVDSGGGNFWISFPGWTELKYVAARLAGKYIILYTYLIIFAIAGLLLVFKNKLKFILRDFSAKYYLALLLFSFIPIIIGFTVAQFSPAFLYRYYIYTTIPLLLLISYISDKVTANKAIGFILFAIILGFNIKYFKIDEKRIEEWKNITHKISELKDDNTAIIISAAYKWKCFTYYYDKEIFSDYKNTLTRLKENNIFRTNGSGLKNERLKKFDKLIYIESHRHLVDAENKTLKKIEEMGYKKIGLLAEKKINASVFTRKNDISSFLKILEEDSHNRIWDKKIMKNKFLKSYEAHFFSDMEMSEMGNNITNEKCFSGEYSCIVNKDYEYSISLNLKEADLFFEPTNLKISFMVFSENTTDAKLVIDADGENSDIWKGINVSDLGGEEDSGWISIRDVNYTFEFDKFKSLKVYFWNPSDKNIYIDDISVKLY